MNDSGEVKLHFLDYWRVVRIRWAIITIAFLLVVATAAVTCFFLPREFYSKVILEVKSDDYSVKIPGSQSGYQGGRDLSLAPTQFQILQHKQTLYPVIESLKLVDAWSRAMGTPLQKEQAYIILSKKMQLREVRNTDLIEVGVYSTDPQEAANIANTIARVYLEKRRSDQMEILNRGLNQLEEEVLKKRKAMEAAQEEMIRIRTEQGIMDFNPDQSESSQAAPDQTIVATSTQQVDEAKVEIAKLRSQLEQTASLKAEELMAALNSLNINDPTISKILPLYQDSVSGEAGLLNSGLGENHPKIKQLRAQKAVYAKQIEDQMAAIRSSLNTKLKVQEAMFGELVKKLESSRKALNEGRKQSVEYVNAKNNYINAKRLFETSEAKLQTERMQAGISTNPGSVRENAEPGLYPARPNVIAYMAVAIVTGLIIGLGLAFFIEYLDTSVKTLDDIERFLQVPVLAVIPKGVEALIDVAGDCADAEAYRILRTNLEFNRKNPNDSTITVVSGGPGEGKSTTLNNLAVICANGGYNVLVVDADLRRPSQHTIFGVENTAGLSDILTGRAVMDAVIQATKVSNLSFLPSGQLPQDAVGILNSNRMIEFIAEAKKRYDLVFFDSPPILGVSDASILASEVDMTMMVVQYRRFPRSMLLRVKQSVLNVGGNLVGAVLNSVDAKHDNAYEYYTQYYDYYSEETRPGNREARASAKTQGEANATRSRRAKRPVNYGDYGDY